MGDVVLVNGKPAGNGPSGISVAVLVTAGVVAVTGGVIGTFVLGGFILFILAMYSEIHGGIVIFGC